VIGQHVPHAVGNHVFKMFASRILTQENLKQTNSKAWDTTVNSQAVLPFVMTFDDFCAMYVCFRDQKDEEVMQLVFSMLKIHPGHITNKTIE